MLFITGSLKIKKLNNCKFIKKMTQRNGRNDTTGANFVDSYGIWNMNLMIINSMIPTFGY